MSTAIPARDTGEGWGGTWGGHRACRHSRRLRSVPLVKHAADATQEGLPWWPLLREPQKATRKHGLKCQCANRAHPHGHKV